MVLGLTELLSSPRLVTRMSLALLWRFAHVFGVTEYYALLAAWHGWYSLEIGVEIAAAVVTGFASWLLFALLYDTAGILVGLVPASMVTVVILIFRFHTRSWALIAALPMVFLPALACARFLDQRMQRSEEEQARARVLKMKAAAYSHAHVRRSDGGGGHSSSALPPRSLNGGKGFKDFGGGGSGGGDGGGSGARGLGGFSPVGGLRGRGTGNASVVGARGGGLQSRRPGMMSTPNLLVLTTNAPDGGGGDVGWSGGGGVGGGSGGGGGGSASKQASGGGKTLTTNLSPIVSQGTSPVDSPMSGDAGAGAAAGSGAGVSGHGVSPTPGSRGEGASGLGVSPTPGSRGEAGRGPATSDRPGHSRNQHSWGSGGSGSGGGGGRSSSSKSPSPTKRVTGTGTGGAGGLPRSPSWQGQQHLQAKALGGSSTTFDSFDSWV